MVPRIQHLAESRPADCVGPVLLPPDVGATLRDLATTTGVDDVEPFLVCAEALAARLSPAGVVRRVRVAHGPRDTLTTADPPSVGTTFRDALRRREILPDPHPAGPAEVLISVSEDARQVFAETTDTTPDAPGALCWVRTFAHLLASMARDPLTAMDAHPLVGTAERHRILHGLNRHRRARIGDAGMAGPFEEQVRRTPDAPALAEEQGGTLTYRELNERANRLAHHLRATGAGPGTRTGVLMERGIPLVVALHAVVKAGAAYVPLDPDLPDRRLAHMADDTAPTHVLTDGLCATRVPDGPWRVLDVESGGAAWAAAPTGNPRPAGSPEDLLNILYTSGSTGRPKGVAYPVGGALAHLFWMQRKYPFRPGDSALFKTSPGFDVSIWEIFWPLYHGARLVICRPGAHRDPRHLARLVTDQRISTFFAVPTVLAPILENVQAERAGHLRRVLCGGEAVTPRVRDACHARLPAAELVNCYGPTEAGTVTDMVLAREPGAPVPLGRPGEHFAVRVLGQDLGVLPVGMPGEAYIAGDPGLAQSYWGAPARTAERFVADPFGPPGSRMYRTGDLCRYRDDGVLEHLGRIDRQVKIRGMRIEPGEIEWVLAGHPAVADCAVLAVPPDEPGSGEGMRLLGFVVPGGGVPEGELDVAAVAEHAAGALPVHLRPDRIVAVPRIPATVNGKIDREALLAQEHSRRVDRDAVEAPVDALEAGLVAIYRRTTKAVAVSVLDTFGELGGHSLLAIELLDACERSLGARPALVAVFTGTIRDVAASIRDAVPAPAGGAPG